MRWLFVLIIAGMAGGWFWWSNERPVTRAPGMVAPDEPRQTDIDPPPRFEARGHVFYARARYEIVARVLRKEIYHLGKAAAIAPVDVAVGWGPLSDTRVIETLEFSQMGRFFYWRPRQPGRLPVPVDMLVTHAAQMHLVPATDAIEKRLRKIRPGQIVAISGYLVDVRDGDGFRWSTSLTRTDTGKGACELVWVETLSLE